MVILKRVVRSLCSKVNLSKTREVRECTKWMPGGERFQTEGTASAKSIRRVVRREVKE